MRSVNACSRCSGRRPPPDRLCACLDSSDAPCNKWCPSASKHRPLLAITNYSCVMSNEREVATLGGGCFWCVEAVLERLRGIEDVVSGYAGGQVKNPSYREVCGGKTGHAEVVQITYDPGEISYRELLEVFFTTHDPTTPNRQGADVGPQYRSIILYHDDEQKRIAEEVLREIDASDLWDDPVVTEIEPLETFYRAEDYHQDYYRSNTMQPYCQVVIAPKVAKLRKQYLEKLKAY